MQTSVKNQWKWREKNFNDGMIFIIVKYMHTHCREFANYREEIICSISSCLRVHVGAFL